MNRDEIELLLRRYLSSLIVTAVLGYIDGQRAEIEKLTKERDTWHSIAVDHMDADDEFRKVAGKWDTSDSYGIDSHANILDRVLQEIERQKHLYGLLEKSYNRKQYEIERLKAELFDEKSLHVATQLCLKAQSDSVLACSQKVAQLKAHLATAKHEVWEKIKAEVKAYPYLYCSVLSNHPEKLLAEWIEQQKEQL